MDFAARLYELREDSDMKQNVLAEKINLKPSAVSKYEKGLSQPSINTLKKLSEIFSVSVDYLIGNSDIPNPYTIEKLTVKEANFIYKFRQLSKENQIRVDERINILAEKQRPTV